MDADPLPITLLTGFLGSGKTTVLNHLVRTLPRTAILMNEFGEVALDHQLLQKMEGPMALLSGGCVCCTISGSLSPTLKNLWMARQKGDIPRVRARHHRNHRHRRPGAGARQPAARQLGARAFPPRRRGHHGRRAVRHGPAGRAFRGGEAGGGGRPAAADQDRPRPRRHASPRCANGWRRSTRPPTS